MIIIKTYNEHHYERGLIECESIEYCDLLLDSTTPEVPEVVSNQEKDRDSLICLKVQCVYGATNILDYSYSDGFTHIIIPSRDLSQATAA